MCDRLAIGWLNCRSGQLKKSHAHILAGHAYLKVQRSRSKGHGPHHTRISIIPVNINVLHRSGFSLGSGMSLLMISVGQHRNE